MPPKKKKLDSQNQSKYRFAQEYLIDKHKYLRYHINRLAFFPGISQQNL